jgi:hypothetical protein
MGDKTRGLYEKFKGRNMRRGKNADTLFSAFWSEHGERVNPSMTPYYLMRWAFREAFAARGERDKQAAALNRGGVTK